MLAVGDVFLQGELTYKVIGKDGQGRAVSTLFVEDEDGEKAETKRRRSTKNKDE